MGTAHGAEELGMCSHGHACQVGALGRYIGFCLGYWPYLRNGSLTMPAKIFCKTHSFVP
jgi:hypothetical protein